MRHANKLIQCIMRDLFKDISVDEITPGLFIGNMACVESEKVLRQLKTTAVVSVVSKYREPFPQVNTSYGLRAHPPHPLEKLLDVENRLVIFVDDTRSDNIFRYFEGACEFIDHQLSMGPFRDRTGLETAVHGGSRNRTSFHGDHTVKQSGRVLVHCTLGISRSVTIVAAYIMWKWGSSATRALQYIQKRRNVSSPNEGFIDQLLVWEELRCNPWLSRRLHIRPRAYYDMVNRLENHKRVREVKNAVERAAKDNATRRRQSAKDSTKVRSMEPDTIRYCTRARY